MTYEIFANEVVPMISELKEECADMTKEEFDIYKEKVIEEVRQKNLSTEFINRVFDIISPESVIA